MSVIFFLIVAASIAFALTAEAMPMPLHREDERSDDAPALVGANAGAVDEDVQIEYVEDESPSPLLEAAVVETAPASFGTMAVARLVASLALSGFVIGAIVVAVAKLVGIMLRHFAANS